MAPFTEQRQALRSDVSTPIIVWLPAAKRSYHGGCVNLSKRGAMIRLPLSSPIRAGQTIKLQIQNTEIPDFSDAPLNREFTAHVIRVDRQSELTDAKILAALAFDE